MTTARPNPALHAAAVVTLCFTFPLIFLGGLVTSHGAGMSVPDWPNSYGYNMFLFPPSRWTGGILYEHTHRLLGTVVGFAAVVLTLVAWGPARTPRGRKLLVWIGGGLFVANALGTAAMLVTGAARRAPSVAVPEVTPVPAATAGSILSHGAVTAVGMALVVGVAWFCRSREPRRWVRWLATACLVAVCVQGLLGGLRVDLINLPLAMVHGCFAQVTFCLMVVTAAVTGRAWSRLAPVPIAGAGWVLRLSFAAVAVVFAQLIVAAVMRHLGAGLAIPGVLAYGHLLPPVSDAGLAAVNHQRIWTDHMDPVTFAQLWLHFTHRLGAVAVSTAVVTLLVAIARSGRRALAGPAVALGVLLVAQVTLGVLTVYYRKPADVASLHVACGALVLATTVLIAVRAAGLYVYRSPARPAAVTAADGPAGVLVAV